MVGVADAGYLETFDIDNAGWEYAYGGGATLVDATWVSDGGGGGYISGTSDGLYGVQNLKSATPGLYGSSIGDRITVDTKVTDSEVGTAQFYVGRGGTYFIDGTWSIGSDTAWTTHTEVMNTTTFVPWTGQNDYVYTLAEVLAAPTDIGIFFGGVAAGGTGNLLMDNFGVGAGATPVPEPLTMATAFLAIAGLGGYIRRRTSRGSRVS